MNTFRILRPFFGSVDIQIEKGKAKAYQVKQVLLAIDKLEQQKNER